MIETSKLRRGWNWIKKLYEIPRVESEEDDHPLQSDETPIVFELRSRFENREAIYIEKGAWKVRLTDIGISAERRVVWANVEEIPSTGLGRGLSERRGRKQQSPKRWEIVGGYLTEFSDSCWKMGYGGWSVYFDPKVVQGVSDFAARVPVELSERERYNRIMEFMYQERILLGGCATKVFPEG